MNKFTGAIAGAVVAGAVTLSAPGAALAAETVSPKTPAQCENGANGFIDISDSATGTVQRSVSLGFGVTAQLHSGSVSGAQRGWAKIVGSTISGDQIWMDWTTNGGSSWLQCGPFSVSSAGATKTSAAKTTSSSSLYLFRACGRAVGGSTQCTAWW